MKGEEWNGTHCIKCQAGYHRNVTGNFDPCEICPTGEVAPAEGYELCGESNPTFPEGESNQFWVQTRTGEHSHCVFCRMCPRRVQRARWMVHVV